MRLRLPRCVSLVLLACICVPTWMILTATTSANAQDWPQYRGPNGNGKVDASLGEVDWSDGPKIAWKIKTPLGFSSFAVANDRAFTLIAEPDESGELHEQLLAVDANTGDQLWKVTLGPSDYEHDGGNAGAPGNRGGDGPRSTPAIADDRVYVYDSHLRLSCFAAESGEAIWQHDVVEQFDGRQIKWYNATSPVLENGTVYVAGGGAGKSFLAFDAETGSLRWASGDETITHATPQLATLNDQKQVIFFVQSGLVAVDAASGEELWRAKFPFSVSTAASPVTADNLVYCSAGYGVGAGLFEVAPDGQVKEVWFKPNELMNHWSTPLIHEGHLYGIYEFKKYGRAPLQCVELTTGEIKWNERGFGPGNCILVGDKLVVLSDAGEVVIAKAQPDVYQELGRAQVISGKCWSTPAYSDGRIFVRSTEEAACIVVE